MIKIITLLFITFVLTNQIYCQTDKSNNKRPPFELKLFVNDSAFYNAPMNESYYVINDSMIQIFPGEKIYIEADVDNNRLKNFNFVSEIKDKSKTLIIEFQQKVNGKNHEQMILTITNPFKQDLYYTAIINLMKNKKWRKTTVVPVMAGLISIEMWPDIITSMVLKGFELKDK
jgi:hypothetical protein